MGLFNGWEDDNWGPPADGGGFFRRLFGLGNDRYASSLARETEEDLRSRSSGWRAGRPLRDDERHRDQRVRDTQHYMGRGREGHGQQGYRSRDPGGRYSRRDDRDGGGGW